MSAIELIPSAKRLIRSLRDMGYDFSQAVADIVDNSIEAKGSLVAIDVEFDGDESWVRIADNGEGMKPDELREAMRYGAARDYDIAGPRAQNAADRAFALSAPVPLKGCLTFWWFGLPLHCRGRD